MDDAVVPESLSAALSAAFEEENAATEISVSTMTAHLISTRRLNERRALVIAQSGRCDECRCEIGSVSPDDCGCPCHCACCCPPLFHCLKECSCECDCHYQASSDDEGGDQGSSDGEQSTRSSSDASIASGQASPANSDDEEGDGSSADTQKREGNQTGKGEIATDKRAENPIGERNRAAGGKAAQDDADDEMDGTAPLGSDIDQLTVAQLAEVLGQQLARAGEQAELNSKRVLQRLFTINYDHASKGVRNEKSPNGHLPHLTDTEMELLYAYVRVLHDRLKKSTTRINNDLRDVAIAAVRSTWTLSRIIDQRETAAKLPREPPTNVWTQRDPVSPTEATPRASRFFRFDDTQYSNDEIQRLQAVCTQEHAFATATREPTADEWNILQGMMAGKIIASELPQFLKRICTITQLVWIHEEIVQRTEGELWVALPPLTKMYNYNQTTRRLVSDIRQSAKHQQWDDGRLEVMLSKIKAVAYNQDMHSIHFFFFTKGDAVQFENMKLPFRTSKLPLQNPDTKLRRSENNAGLPTDADDGLVNDRYQAHHKCRLVNAARTLNLLALVSFLQALTNDGLKSACPLDTYGQQAEGSVSWDIFCKTPRCPPQLENIHRIDYMGHKIIVLHRPDGRSQPCLQCAQIGHQAANCATPKEDWNATTLTVTAVDVEPYVMNHRPWTTLEELQQAFVSVGRQQPPSPGKGTTDTALPAPTPDQTLGATDAQESEPPNSPASPGDALPAPNKAPPPDPVGTAEPVFQAPKPKRKKHKHRLPKPVGGTHDEDNQAADPEPSRANATGTPRPQNTNVSNRFVNLADSDDDNNDDSDEETKGDLGSQVPSQTMKRGPGKRPPHVHNEDEELERAVHQAKLERVRRTLESVMADHARRSDHTVIDTAISRAKPNVTVKATLDWILEAIGGRLTATPQTGNCQYYAIVEALLQLDLKLQQDATPMVDMAKLFKYGLLRAHQATSAADRASNHVTAILDLPADTPTDLSAEEQQRRVTEFYTDVARSSSALSSILPERLWGRWDTARMGAKLLNHMIFIITKSTDPTNAYLNVIRMQKNRHGEEYAAFLQPGVADWLELMAEETRRTKSSPIVLYNSGSHYNSVIFDRENPANVAPAKKLKTVKLDVLWRPPAVAAKPTNTSAAVVSRSRRAVLDSTVRLTEDDLLDFLQDDGWSEAEKMELVNILVSGATNYRELLTFSTAGCETPQSSPVSETDAGGKDSTSEYDPDSDEETGPSASSQASTLMAQGTAEYRAWADAMWDSVTEAWISQFNERLPALTDTKGLVQLIADDPEALPRLDAGVTTLSRYWSTSRIGRSRPGWNRDG
jgi:hypothetical protein